MFNVNFYKFSDYKVKNTQFFTGKPLTNRLICQIVGPLYLFIFYTGTSLHGGVTRDFSKVIIPNYFLTYLLADKQTERPPTSV